jgi:hypothetical protein
MYSSLIEMMSSRVHSLKHERERGNEYLVMDLAERHMTKHGAEWEHYEESTGTE